MPVIHDKFRYELGDEYLIEAMMQLEKELERIEKIANLAMEKACEKDNTHAIAGLIRQVRNLENYVMAIPENDE